MLPAFLLPCRRILIAFNEVTQMSIPPPLNSTSMERLSGLHPLLAAITLRAMQICEHPFQITDGVRSLEDQIENRAKGGLPKPLPVLI